LGGASAGANIALGAALQIRDARLPQPAVLMLLYGAYLGGISTESWRNFGDGRFGLAAATMALFWNAYAGANPPRADPRITPARANLQGLPRSLLMNAELDILRDDSVLLARMLRSAGVDVEELGYPGAVHGFTQYVKTCALARRALTEAGAVLARAVAGSS
ncbi:MAG: alpha/beta hydrolase fold domain-containing protein, partial [Proteobacteria bacterium]|nr:alpha/beta hydrolase fold domain-containing protein [Pseudomonadota bacterium]